MAGLFDFLGGGSGGGLFGGSYGQDDDPYQAQRLQLAFNGDPASIRFNNPGAQYPGPSALAFGTTGTETIGGGHKIAVFPDPESGAAAQFDLLNRGYSGMTLGDAIRKWSGGNSSPQYISSVSKATGISPSTVLTPEILQSPEFAVPLAKAMARQEAGRDFPMSDEQWQAALARANGGSPIASGSPAGLPSQASELPGGAQTAIPAMAQPTAGQMPPSGLPAGNAAPPTGLPQPQAMNPLLAGFLGFANSRSPMGALGNLVGGLATGHRTDELGYEREQEQAAQLATYRAGIDSGLSPQQATLLALNPKIGAALAPDVFGAPKVVDVGSDILGRPIKMLQQGRKFSQIPGVNQPGQSGLAAGIDENKPLFDQLPKPQQGIVDSMLAGRMAMPSSFALKTPYWNTLIAAADEKAKALGQPGFDATTWGQRNATATDFSTKGKAGQTITALDTVQHHLREYSDAIENLDQGGWTYWNSLRNGIANNTPLDETRTKALQRVADARKAVLDEMSAAYKAGKVSDSEIKQWSALMDLSDSKVKARQGLTDFAHLLNGKRDALLSQARNLGVEPKGFDASHNAEVTKLLEDRNAGQSSQQAAQPESPNKSIPKVGEVRKGYKFLGGNPADQKSWEKVQ